MSPSSPPFPASSALISSQSAAYVPGEPTVALDASSVQEFLQRELETTVLDELYQNLWMVARKSNKSIDALHRQTSKGGSITPMEDIGLHLVWNHRTIHVKLITSLPAKL